MLDRDDNLGSMCVVSSRTVGCSFCGNFIECVTTGLDSVQLGAFSAIVRRSGPVRSSDYVYRMEDAFTSLYVVKTGSVKVEVITPDGVRHVTGFYFPGELVGGESIGLERYGSDCIALESTALCKLPFEAFLSLCASVPRLQRNFSVDLAKRIRASNVMNMRRRAIPAERRLLDFLCEFLTRKGLDQKRDRYAKVPLSMSKGDIASYLGLAPESLSRAMAVLERRGYIRRDRGNVHLLRLADECHNAIAPK